MRLKFFAILMIALLGAACTLAPAQNSSVAPGGPNSTLVPLTGCDIYQSSDARLDCLQVTAAAINWEADQTAVARTQVWSNAEATAAAARNAAAGADVAEANVAMLQATMTMSVADVAAQSTMVMAEADQVVAETGRVQAEAAEAEAKATEAAIVASQKAEELRTARTQNTIAVVAAAIIGVVVVAIGSAIAWRMARVSIEERKREAEYNRQMGALQAEREALLPTIIRTLTTGYLVMYFPRQEKVEYLPPPPEDMVVDMPASETVVVEEPEAETEMLPITPASEPMEIHVPELTPNDRAWKRAMEAYLKLGLSLRSFSRRTMCDYRDHRGTKLPEAAWRTFNTLFTNPEPDGWAIIEDSQLKEGLDLRGAMNKIVPPFPPEAAPASSRVPLSPTGVSYPSNANTPEHTTSHQ